MTIKKIIIIVLAVFSIQLVQAQGSKVSTASFLMSDYEVEKNSDDLLKAKKAIDEASKHESTMNNGKTWFYRGKVNYLLSVDETTKADGTDYTSEAITSFEKALTIEDKRFRDDDKVLTYLKDMAADAFNASRDLQIAKEYQNAYNGYQKVLEIDEIVSKNGGKLQFDANMAVQNSALAAELGKMFPEAISSYKILLENEPSAKLYRDLTRVYNSSGDDENYLKTLEEGIAAFPENSDLLNNQISYLLKNDRREEAMSKIDKAIELNPENSSLYLVKANSLEQMNDNEGAIKLYNKVLELNPNDTKALFNIGVLFFNDINKIIQKMNTLTTSPDDTKIYNGLVEERKVLATKAKPYFEKVLELKPEDAASKKTIARLDNWINN